MDDKLPLWPTDGIERVLCVVAHPDDMEYGASAAVAAWTAAGIEVRYLLLTRGEAGIDTMQPDTCASARMEEQRTGCRAVGVERVDFLEHPDGMLVYGLDLRRDIARAIREFRPDAVLTGTWQVEFMGMLNQADHRAAGMATLDAVRDAGNRWVFPELADAGLEPHSPRWLLVTADDRPTHGVDVTGAPVEAGIASLEAHKAYLAALPWHPAPRDLVEWITTAQGNALGVPNGVAFRAWDFQAPPPM
ncbi:PIG-L deacetylase family protein [Nocardioides jejuensis]|uniref:PIG-L family deacetylase n=1 Tax=Nocardioides jejuensis TaxID=2502782 RepID=A0A4R1CIC5_9ACTN|nr:PIG-L deacetylase family protein [Nocardioides jejuensis]TCJ30761.1 PIG-L family deacetylase [Nocardioides jejuensis]